MISIISQLPSQVSTVILIVLLILAFIIAFKVMKMVFQTILVSVLSAVFYVALTFLFFDSTPTLNNTLMFAFLGSTLYMLYSFLVSAYSIASKLIAIPYHVLKFALKPFVWLYGKIKEEYKLKQVREKLERGDVSKDFSPDKDKSTKDVVLDKVKRQQDGEDN
jgi:predicted membrane protein